MSKKYVALADQRNDCLLVLDADAPDPRSADAAVWEWSTTLHGDVANARRCAHRLDAVRLRENASWGGAVVATCSSYGLVAIVSYPDGRCLFDAYAGKTGPHDVEILPNGLLAVACARGEEDLSLGSIRLYSACTKDDPRFVEDTLPKAHGVIWDPEREVLWAAGDTELVAYRISGTREAPVMERVEGLGATYAPCGHNLSVDLHDPDKLWISNAPHVLKYSKSLNRILPDYPAKALVDREHVKSINSFPDGTVIFNFAQNEKNATARHNTDTLCIVRPDNAQVQTVVFDGSDGTVARDFYKVRVFSSKYQ